MLFVRQLCGIDIFICQTTGKSGQIICCLMSSLFCHKSVNRSFVKSVSTIGQKVSGLSCEFTILVQMFYSSSGSTMCLQLPWYQYFVLAGQGICLHFFFLNIFFGQDWPYVLGFIKTSLCLVFHPVPHDLEHSDQVDQAETWQSISASIPMGVIGLCGISSSKSSSGSLIKERDVNELSELIVESWLFMAGLAHWGGCGLLFTTGL